MRPLFQFFTFCCSLWVTGVGRKFARIFADMSLFSYIYLLRQTFVTFKIAYCFRGFSRIRLHVMFWLSSYRQTKIRKPYKDFIGLIRLVFLALWDAWCLVYLQIIAVVIYSYVSFYTAAHYSHVLDFVNARTYRRITQTLRGYRKFVRFKRLRLSYIYMLFGSRFRRYRRWGWWFVSTRQRGVVAREFFLYFPIWRRLR